MLWDLHAVRGTILRTVFVEPKNLRLDNTERICEEILKLGKDIYMKPFMDRQKWVEYALHFLCDGECIENASPHLDARAFC